MAPCIDYTAFPHIVDNILGFARLVWLYELWPHRLLSREIRDRVDRIHLKHIRVDFNGIVVPTPYHDPDGKTRTYGYPDAKIGWKFPRAPVLYPLHSRRPTDVNSSRYSAVVAKINNYTTVIDLIRKPNPSLLTFMLHVPILRVFPGDDYEQVVVSLPWTCDTLVVRLGRGSCTLEPSAELAARLGHGLTKVVLLPSYPWCFDLPIENAKAMAQLDVIVPLSYNVGLTLREVYDLLVQHECFSLTLVGLEAINEGFRINHEDPVPPDLSPVQAMGPDATFVERFSTYLHTRYSDQPQLPESELIQRVNTYSIVTPLKVRIDEALARIKVLSMSEYAATFDSPEHASFVMEPDF